MYLKKKNIYNKYELIVILATGFTYLWRTYLSRRKYKPNI